MVGVRPIYTEEDIRREAEEQEEKESENIQSGQKKRIPGRME
jgi:hypothetical protein